MATPNFVAIVIGNATNPERIELKAELQRRTQALTKSGEGFGIFDQHELSFPAPAAHSAAVCFCRQDMSAAEIAAIVQCKNRSIPIVPVVGKLSEFTTVAPKEVADYNGFELADIADIGELAGLVLEMIGLQRSKQKIFISYARRDSSTVAEQLRGAFTARWYSVFLDTISIRPGALFQDELLQELADSNVVVLLNSLSVKDRPYVQQEIAFADQAGVGGVQVLWPNVDALRQGSFFMPVELNDQRADISSDQVNNLTPQGVMDVVRQVADLRTALQQQREEQIVKPIVAYAQAKGWNAIPYLGRHIVLKNGYKHIHLDVALGVPTSVDLERAFNAASPPEPGGRLVYDPLGITNRQAKHLDFLGSHLKLNYLDPKTTLQWTLIP